MKCIDGAPGRETSIKAPLQQTRQSEQMPMKNEGKFHGFVECAPDAIFLIDATGLVATMNARAESMFGTPRAAVIGRSVEKLVPGFVAHEMRLSERHGESVTTHACFEVVCQRGAGESFVAEISLGKLPAEENMQVIAIVRDLGNRNRMADEKNRLTALFEATPDFVGFMDGHRQTIHVNRAGRAMLGLERQDDGSRLALQACMPAWAIEVVRTQAVPAARANGYWAGETALLGKDGSEIPVSQVVVCHDDGDGDTQSWSTICRDISERKSFEAVLLDQITHDALTSLPSRTWFNQRLRSSVERATVENHSLAVIVLGIDHFKNVNDTFDHACGDALLKDAANRMRAALPSDYVLARQGGDEFIVLIQDIRDRQQLLAAAEQLLDCMRKPFYVSGKEIFLGASCGISLFPEDQQSAEGLLHNAGMALNIAKKEGRNCFRFHTAEMDQRIQERLELESNLHYALEYGQLFLHFQPRITLQTGAIVGVEALLRWRHPVLGLIPPDRFIPVAEESGLIEKIGLWVLEAACIQAQQWQQPGLPPVRVSVNLSARQFRQTNLIDSVQAILQQSGLSPACLELEITESTVMHDTGSAIKTLRALKELGVVLSIDDFGTGYSSLSYLKLFPIDVLKIDRSFVKDVIDDPNDAAITRAIVALAHSLDLDVVAEGVETAAQVAFLEGCGCDEMQGYYFSRPVSGEALASMLMGAARKWMAPANPVPHGDARYERQHTANDEARGGNRRMRVTI